MSIQGLEPTTSEEGLARWWVLMMSISLIEKNLFEIDRGQSGSIKRRKSAISGHNDHPVKPSLGIFVTTLW